MESGSQCWVCSLPMLKGDRLTHVPSLGFEVHSRCADAVLRDESPDDDSLPDTPRA